MGWGVCERTLKLHLSRKGLSGKAKAKTGIGKSDLPGLQGGLGKRGHGGTVNPPCNRKGKAGNPPPSTGAPELYPDPGNWFAPPGRNRSGSGGNEAGGEPLV